MGARNRRKSSGNVTKSMHSKTSYVKGKKKMVEPHFIGKSGLEAFLFRASMALSLSKNNTLTSLDFDANV